MSPVLATSRNPESNSEVCLVQASLPLDLGHWQSAGMSPLESVRPGGQSDAASCFRVTRMIRLVLL
jgi:hypothetical protein